MCQYWFKNGSLENGGELTSPGSWNNPTSYGHNLDCTWIINVEDGYFINLEIYTFRVRYNSSQMLTFNF